LHYTNAEFAVSSRTDRTYRRDDMPKDPTKNVDRYKIRGGVINEYEYHENQEALGQVEPRGDGKLIPGTPPEEKPQKGTKGTKTKKAATSANTKNAAKTKKAGKTKKAAKKAAKKATGNTTRGASAKKLAARKAAKK
jgi:hypothetical protein